MAHLDVVQPRDDVEAALAPAMPDRREEEAAVSATRREHREKWQLEQVAELGDREGLAHAVYLTAYATSLSELVTASARSFFRLWFSIWRIRSRVTLKARPTSSSVRGCWPSSP